MFLIGFITGSFVAASATMMLVALLIAGKNNDLLDKVDLLEKENTNLTGRRCIKCIKPLLEELKVKYKACDCKYVDDCPGHRREVNYHNGKDNCSWYKLNKSNDEVINRHYDKDN